MRLEHATSPLEDGRDVVVYPTRGGWGFRLPAQHTITVNEELGLVYLATPDHGSGYRLEHLEESVGEIRVRVGDPTDDAHAVGGGRVPALRAYAFPRIQDELSRLKSDLVHLGGREQEANAWAQGASYDSHTTWLRARIRELRNVL